ncbi:MAG: Mrp/NBP35 family ATP-binding protein [Bacteroidota bacterium]
MQFSQEDVIEALRHVEEPDLKQDLISLNMVRDISIQGAELRFTVILTTPACPLKEVIRKRCEDAIHQHIGAQVKVQVDMDAEVTTQRKNTPLLPDVKNIVAIASGKGGVGKSTVSANLALALAQSGARVGLIDADIFGPSLPLMFGVEDEKPSVTQQGERSFIVPIEKLGVKIISMGFLSPAESAVVWRGPMASKALQQFIGDTLWGELDYLLVDLPPGTSDIHLTLTQSLPLTGAVIVTTPQKVALADARKGLAMFRQAQINVPILGVVENMSYFTPEELPDKKYYIFGEGGGALFARDNVLPFLGEIPLVQGIRESGDQGIPAVGQTNPITKEAFEALAEALAQQIAIRNAA